MPTIVNSNSKETQAFDELVLIRAGTGLKLTAREYDRLVFLARLGYEMSNPITTLTSWPALADACKTFLCELAMADMGNEYFIAPYKIEFDLNEKEQQLYYVNTDSKVIFLRQKVIRSYISDSIDPISVIEAGLIGAYARLRLDPERPHKFIYLVYRFTQLCMRKKIVLATPYLS